MKTHCRQWVCGHCDCLGISLIFRLPTFDVRIGRQKSSNSANRVFYISLNKGYIGKAIFFRLFSARYHNLKKKQKKTILGLCRCSVDNCSLNPGDLPCQFQLLSHTCTMGGTYSGLFQWRPAFSALWRRGSSVVSVHHINNFWNTRSSLTKFSGQSLQWLRIVCAKLHVKRLRIDRDINEKCSADVVTTLAQGFALITFEVLNQTPPNLLGSCRSSSRWCLQNYIKNGLELTSELTSKWIYIYWNTQTNFTLISLITFEVLVQTLQNLQDSGHNTIWWCLQSYMEDGWEFTSELTSKWITFEILNQISHWSH